MLKNKAKLLVLTLLSATLTLGGCATTTASGGTDAPKTVVCKVFQPISWSSKDTDETIKEVKAHNAVYLALCPTK